MEADRTLLAVRGRTLREQYFFEAQLEPGCNGGERPAVAGGHLVPAESLLDRIFCTHRALEPLRRLPPFTQYLGQLQVVRLDRLDADLRHRTKPAFGASHRFR